jgi:hypothetical protein
MATVAKLQFGDNRRNRRFAPALPTPIIADRQWWAML